MELRLLRASGLRESSVLCVKVGSRQSFVPYDSIQRGVFKLPDTGESQKVRVELFELVGTAHFSVESQETCFDVALMPVQDEEHMQAEAALESAMSLALQLSASSGMPEYEDLTPKVWPELCCQAEKPKVSAARHQAAIAASKMQPYMEQHNLFNVMQELLHAVLKEKPMDPLAFMIKVLRGGAVASRRGRPQTAHTERSFSPQTKQGLPTRPQSAFLRQGSRQASEAVREDSLASRKPLEPLPIISPLQAPADTGALSTMSSSKHQHRSIVPGERRMVTLPLTKSPKRPREHAANAPLGATLPSPQRGSAGAGQQQANAVGSEEPFDPIDTGLAPLAPIGAAASSQACGTAPGRCHSMPSLAKPVLTTLRQGPSFLEASRPKDEVEAAEAEKAPAPAESTLKPAEVLLPSAEELRGRAAQALLAANEKGCLATHLASSLELASSSQELAVPFSPPAAPMREPRRPLSAAGPRGSPRQDAAPSLQPAALSPEASLQEADAAQCYLAEELQPEQGDEGDPGENAEQSPRPPLPTMWMVAAQQGEKQADACGETPASMPPFPTFSRMQTAGMEASTELPSHNSLSPGGVDSIAAMTDPGDLSPEKPLAAPSQEETSEQSMKAPPLNSTPTTILSRSRDEAKITTMPPLPSFEKFSIPRKPDGPEQMPEGHPCCPEQASACRTCHPTLRRVREAGESSALSPGKAPPAPKLPSVFPSSGKA